MKQGRACFSVRKDLSGRLFAFIEWEFDCHTPALEAVGINRS